MVTPSRLNESDPRSYVLQSEYEVVTPDSSVLVVGANVHTLEDGDLQFWNIAEDGAWSFVACLACGEWESFRSVSPMESEYPATAVAVPEPPVENINPKVYRDEYEEALLKEGLAPEVASQLAAILGRSKPEPVVSEESMSGNGFTEDNRQAILAGLHHGNYPPEEFDGFNGTVRPPQKLKDVWEGRGEATDDHSDDLANERYWDARITAGEQKQSDEDFVQGLREAFGPVPDPSIRRPSYLKEEVEPWHGRASGS